MRFLKPEKIRFSVLLFLILLEIVAIPFIRGYVRYQIALNIFTAVILISAIWATGIRKYKAVVGFSLAIIYIVLTWTNHLRQDDTLLILGNVVGILLFGFVLYSVLRYVVFSQQVNREVLFAAIVSYLLIAIIWAFAYGTLELIHPGSFKVANADAVGRDGFSLFYFSFVTITTLGYGDITPLTAKAASLSMLEAIIGQIYLVVLVAWLVGMYVSRKSR